MSHGPLLHDAVKLNSKFHSIISPMHLNIPDDSFLDSVSDNWWSKRYTCFNAADVRYWEIKENCLYLVGMYDGMSDCRFKPVFADWVTATIHVSQGNTMRQWALIVSEAEVHFTIESGKITNEINIDNSETEKYKDALMYQTKSAEIDIEKKLQEIVGACSPEQALKEWNEHEIEAEKLLLEKRARLKILRQKIKKVQADMKAGRPVPIKPEHIEY